LARFDVDVNWQQASQTTYQTLFDVALDLLPVQATSVPSERVFSSSAETDTKKRNRITPALMEALQMLKFALKRERLNFTEDLITSEESMGGELPADADDMLAFLLGSGEQDAIDQIIQEVGTEDAADVL
jgi:hypothetical protein